jgi:hypothetical protein
MIEIDQTRRCHGQHRFVLLGGESLLGVVTAQTLEHEVIEFRCQCGAALTDIEGRCLAVFARLHASGKRRIGQQFQRFGEKRLVIEIEAAFDQRARKAQCRAT